MSNTENLDPDIATAAPDAEAPDAAAPDGAQGVTGGRDPEALDVEREEYPDPESYPDPDGQPNGIDVDDPSGSEARHGRD